jgi:hypothetical protein
MTRKEIRASIEDTLKQLVESYKIEKPSKRTAKLIEKSSKKIARELNNSLKRQVRKMVKASKKTSRKIKTTAVPV